jgi:hypothetical protein
VASPHAFASDLDLDVHGSGHRITASSYGDARARLVVRGRGNQVDFFAGPCGHRMPSTTAMWGSGERHVLIAPCF